MNRTVVVISGATLSGKSWLLEKLLPLPEFKDVAVVRMDDVRKKWWGAKPITTTGGVFRNELTRTEIKAQLVIHDAPLILVEMPLLTREIHQKPFVEMVRDAERLIQNIEKEMASTEKPAPILPTKVNLSVVMLFCSMARAFDRVHRRDKTKDTTNTIVFDEDRYLSIAARFEIPDPDPALYVPLFIDTTPEGPHTEEAILQEVRTFVRGMPLDPRAMNLRRAAAVYYFGEIRIEAARRDLTRPLI